GFAVLTVGLLLGTRTGVHSSEASIALWMALVGAGMGLAMATASSAALSELSDQQSGIGSAVMQALNKLGGPFGAATLGSAVTAAYTANVHLAGLPPAAADEVRGSVFGGVAVAVQAHSPALLAEVRHAFTLGLDRALLVSAGFALVGAILALAFLPRTSGEREEAAPGE